MKVRITFTRDYEIAEKWIDADGNLTHISDPVRVGGAKPLDTPEPVEEALARLIHPPYFIAGSTPQGIAPWKLDVRAK